MLNGINNISVPSISHFTAQGGRMALPVDSSSLIYSHFQYVSGKPAPEGTNGLPISKLNLLDVLIGRLFQIRESSLSSAAGFEGNLEYQDDYFLDALIETYKNQLLEAEAASAAMPYLPSPDIQPIFSLLS